MRKSYEISASPLYKLWTRKRLASLLGISVNELLSAITSPSYRSFINQDGRLCEQPLAKTEKIHKAIARLLAKLETPPFLMSVKGFSYVDNARHHIGDFPSVRLDISKFYPNTSERRVWEFFRYFAKCSNQVATDLAVICTREGHLPTGSSISSYLAFFANQEMFFRLNELAIIRDCSISVYVDDIVFSGTQANALLLADVINLIHASNLKHNRRKSAVLPAGQPKRITGVIVTKSDIQVPNKRQLAIGSLFSQFFTGDQTCKSSLNGRLSEAAQIQRKFTKKMVTIKG
jgi:RNA-directed DNA polymerase